MNMVTLGALLLLAGGLVNSVPPLNAGLTGVFNGTPVFQMLIGAASIVVGIAMFMKKRVLS